MNKFRVGFGYDVHPLIPGRNLLIGGVLIAYHKGALGHSDADVLLHALTDALLGAAGMGDIGILFPDTDSKYKNADSKLMVKEVVLKIQEKGYKVNNIDATVVLQEPKLVSYISEIRSVIASLLQADEEIVSIKATTNEHLGYIGNSEGIAAFTVVSLVG